MTRRNWERSGCVKKIYDLEILKIKDLKQKEKVKWAIKCDENSNFSHGMINNKLKKSRIHGPSFDGTWIY